MIDVDELERQAKLASGDNYIQVHRDELLFLIEAFRRLFDQGIRQADEHSDEVRRLRVENLELSVRLQRYHETGSRSTDGAAE